MCTSDCFEFVKCEQKYLFEIHIYVTGRFSKEQKNKI